MGLVYTAEQTLQGEFDILSEVGKQFSESPHTPAETIHTPQHGYRGGYVVGACFLILCAIA